MSMSSYTSSPPPYYNDTERQWLLGPGSSNHAIYSSHLAPESQQPIKRPDMSSEPGQESHPDSPRPNGRHSRRSRSRSVDKPHTRCPIWVTMLLLTLVGFVGFYTGQPSESEHNHIRERWEAERQNHEIEVEKWHKDRDARLAQETGEIDRFKREEHNLVVRKQEMIADYTLKEERWLQKMDSYQAKEKDIIRRQEEMENLYHAKEQAWRQKIASFEDEWQRMIDNENRKRERARLYWDDIQGDEYCLANGRKKYTARLANLTPSLDSMEACKFTSITLNGVTYDRPISCENTRSHGVRGHWIADNEGICAAYWEYVKIKECTAPQSGYRRIESKLGVIHAGENAEIICLTTPLYINGQMYSHPMACPNWGAHGFWGIWNVPDDQCN
ncbi:hypothetical protein H2248_011340 [Termitomyces sp. 'cryptogamus']|nr:hypothetical protein H2248_011340 [Termitomyces sp. 'cryptogamus']